jgi:AraC-like DNA-binding protein
MLKRATLSLFFVESLFDAVEQLGLDPADLRRLMGFSPDELRVDGGRIQLAALDHFWSALRVMTGHKAMGLRLAESIRPEMWDVFAQTVGASATLGDALVRAGRFVPLLADGVDLGFNVSGGRTTVVYRGWAPGTQHRESVELAIGIIARYARHVSDGQVRFDGVSFTHSAPADTTVHERLFGSVPAFERPANAVVADSTVLHRAIPGHDAEVCAASELAARQHLERMIRVHSTVRRIEEAVRRELEDCLRVPTIDEVSQILGVPPRTLSRRLRAEGASFQEILDALRHHLADRYLSESRMSISEVAYALGYSDPSAFNKAFRRWTGRAPHEYRRHGARASPSFPSGAQLPPR